MHEMSIPPPPNRLANQLGNSTGGVCYFFACLDNAPPRTEFPSGFSSKQGEGVLSLCMAVVV